MNDLCDHGADVMAVARCAGNAKPLAGFAPPPPPHPCRRAILRIGALALSMAVPFLASGCTLLGIAAYKLSGDPEVAARYVPKKEPMVVYVRRGDNPDAAQFDANRIAMNVTEDLKKNGVGPMIDPTALLDLRPRQRAGGSVWDAATVRPPSATTRGISTAAATAYGPARIPTTPAELGRAVGAKQVLYVDLTTFVVEPTLASELVRGHSEARVRIIDTETGETRWPEDTTQGFTLSASAPDAESKSITSEQAARDEMVQDLSAQIGRLFHKWKPDEMENGTPLR